MNSKWIGVVAALVLLLAAPSVAGSETREREAIIGSVEELVARQDYAALETIAEQFRSTRSRTSSGIWHLTLFNAGLVSALERKPNGAQREQKRFAQWIRRFPTSSTPRLAEAIRLRVEAGRIKGDVFFHKLPRAKQTLYTQHIARLRKHLEDSKRYAGRDPQWYVEMAWVATAQRWPQHEFDQLLAEGFEVEPLFYQLYFAGVGYHAPNWGGSAEAIEKFAREAVRRSSETEGSGMYARIYWYASQIQYGHKLFSDSAIDWPTMRQGMHDVLERYPDSWNINHFAKFSCLAGDVNQTASLMAKISGMPSQEAWVEPSLYEYCDRLGHSLKGRIIEAKM